MGKIGCARGKKAISPSTILRKKVSRDKNNPGNHTLFGAMTKISIWGFVARYRQKLVHFTSLFLKLLQPPPEHSSKPFLPFNLPSSLVLPGSFLGGSLALQSFTLQMTE